MKLAILVGDKGAGEGLLALGAGWGQHGGQALQGKGGLKGVRGGMGNEGNTNLTVNEISLMKGELIVGEALATLGADEALLVESLGVVEHHPFLRKREREVGQKKKKEEERRKVKETDGGE